MLCHIRLQRSLQYEFTNRYMCTFFENGITSKERNFLDAVEKNVKSVSWDLAKPYEEIPGPKSVPVFGNLLKFLPVVGPYHNLNLIDLHQRLRNEFGNIVKLSNLKIKDDKVIVFDPDDIALSYRNEGTWPDRPGLDSLLYYKTKVRPDIFQDGGGMITGKGQEWYNMRSIVNLPLMQPSLVQQYIAGVDQVSKEFTERVRSLAAKHPKGEMPENFLTELNKWSFETINFIGLNKRLGLIDENITSRPDVEQFINDITELIQLFFDLNFKVSLWKWISTPKWRRFVKVLDRLVEFEMKNFNEALTNVNWEKVYANADMELSILERLLQKKKKLAFSAFFDMFFGTVDTTTRAVGASLYFLSKNINKQEKLRHEIIKLLPNDDMPITKDILSEMSYLRAVIKETQRLAPLNIAGARKTQNNLVLSGYQIPKNTTVEYPHLLLCREEKYFVDANKFLPERWLRGRNEEYVTEEAHPFVYMPFGFGVRSCVGRRLAQLQMETLLARIVRNFKISWPHDEMKWGVNVSYGVASPLKFHMKFIN